MTSVTQLAPCLLSTGRPEANGSSRYENLLTSGLHSLGVPSTRYPANALPRWRKQALLLSWAFTGLPAVSAVTNARVSLVHSLESVVVPRARNLPVIVTAHDVCALMRPELVQPRVARLKGWTWRRSGQWDAVIVPSLATRDDVVRCGVDHDRITVIRHCVAEAFTSSDGVTEPPTASGAPYLIAVGPYSLKKGSDLLIRAWAMRAPRDAALVWVGVSREKLEAESRRLGEPPLQRVQAIPQIPDRELAALYAGAVAVVVPSRWEGFSFPVAEALAMGTPAVVSDIPPHREFGPNGLLFFEPEDHEALADRITAIVDAPPAVGHPALPSCVTFAEQHLEVYRRVVEA